MSVLSWLLLAVGVILLATVVVSCVGRARRLDRLHVRTDAARDGLHDALDRRAAAAVAALSGLHGPAGCVPRSTPAPGCGPHPATAAPRPSRTP